jgi:putative transcriptional regulator
MAIRKAPKKNYNRIGELLKGKSIYSLAKDLGMQYSQLHGYVKNKKQPNIETLFRIAKVLKVEAGELLNKI